MANSRSVDQHIAVFGESGSGKTVLVSSFYGAMQEKKHRRDSLFDIVADSQSHHKSLYQSYLGMRDSGRVPLPTQFSAQSYAFSLTLKKARDHKTERSRPFDAIRLIWHDYPGEWFEEDQEGEIAERRVETFRNLLNSDVALLLVDGQKLLDNRGEEERYLKSLLTSFSNGLQLIKDDLLSDGKPFIQFPRIWVFALSKCDLLPDLDVFGFQDLLIGKAGGEMDYLEKVLGGFVQNSELLSVGEDFVLLSSARFEAGKIELAERVGVDLVLPIAAVLPFERHVRWAGTTHARGKVFEHLIRGVGGMGAAFGGVGALATKLSDGKNKLLVGLGILLTHFGDGLEEVAKMGGEKLREANERALAKKQNLRAVLTQFQIDLEEGEKRNVFIRGAR